jgi:hypothetical protein
MQYVPTNPIEAEPDKLAVLKKMFGYPQMPQPGTPIPQPKPAPTAQFPGIPAYAQPAPTKPLFGTDKAKTAATPANAPAHGDPSAGADAPGGAPPPSAPDLVAPAGGAAAMPAVMPATGDPSQSLGGMVTSGLSGVGQSIAGGAQDAVDGVKNFGAMLGA